MLNENGKMSKYGTGVFLSGSVFILLFDQLTKFLCNSHLSYAEPLQLFPGFDLLLVYNTGAAFSFLSDAGGLQRWMLAGISLLVSGVIIVWLIRLPKTDKLLAFALALILGGAIGNLVDRVFLGYVIDFISVYYREYRFATFNVADSAISIGAVLMALNILRGRSDKE